MTAEKIEWVQVGLIRKAVPHPPPPPPPRFPKAEPKPLDQLKACPLCHATVTERCVTEAGKPARYPHSVRLVSRRCPCGQPIPWHRKFWCDRCKREERKRAGREYRRRTRAAARAERDTERKTA